MKKKKEKLPYIPFYLGDYIKDTRVLPLNVRGGWVELIIAMWDNKKRGEIRGTYEDFAGIMNCSIEESTLVIQKLIQKNICNHSLLENGELLLVSRKQKKMVKLSKTRKEVGAKGGNPNLLNQKHKQNPEDEVETNSHSVFALRLLSNEGALDKEAVEISTRTTVNMHLLTEFHANLKNSNVTHHHFSEYKKHLVNWIPKKPKLENGNLNQTNKPDRKIGRISESTITSYLNRRDDKERA